MKVIYTAIISAVISSLCCLPSLIYIVFGVGVFGSLANLQSIRIPAGILSLLLLFISFFSICKNCDINSRKRKTIIMIVLSVMIVFILFYPEILYLFMKDN